MAKKSQKKTTGTPKITAVVWGIKHMPEMNGEETTITLAPGVSLTDVIRMAIIAYAVDLYSKAGVGERFPRKIRYVKRQWMRNHWVVWISSSAELHPALRTIDVFVKSVIWSE